VRQRLGMPPNHGMHRSARSERRMHSGVPCVLGYASHESGALRRMLDARMPEVAPRADGPRSLRLWVRAAALHHRRGCGRAVPDPHPNPIGPGLVAFFTFWPSVICILVGVARRWRARRKHAASPPRHSDDVPAASGQGCVGTSGLSRFKSFFHFSAAAVHSSACSGVIRTKHASTVLRTLSRDPNH
jgi:hypothetical protein